MDYYGLIVTDDKMTDNLAKTSSVDKPLSDVVDSIAKAIALSRTMFYAKDEEISLLTSPARVLLTLIIQPGITRRAISVYLGVTETAIQKSINILIEHGLIAKTKVAIRNVYEIDEKVFLNNTDIRHVIGVINLLVNKNKNQDPF